MEQDYTGADTWAKVPKALKKMRYDSLRPAQEECLKSILGGKDTFVVIPTGGGKTLLASIPALVLDIPVVIFSPLIALMTDQANQLNSHRVKAGFLSSAHTEDQNSIELSDWIDGRTQVLLVAPERLQSRQFRAAMNLRPPKLVVLDEAHCLSQWSSTFRPDYVKVGDFISEMNPDLVLAMTATATKEIYMEVEEVLGRKLALQRHYTPRPNLKLYSATCLNLDQEVMNVARWIKENPEDSTIIYCSSVKHVTDVTAALSHEHKLEVAYYHGQIKNPAEKALQQDLFMSGKVKVIVATNAFGMGIDKPDIRRIIHLDLPLSLEALSQEIGRAGRDGKESECILLSTSEGRRIQELLWESSNPTARRVQQTLSYFKNSLDPRGVAHASTAVIQHALDDDRSVPSAIAFLVSRGVIDRREGLKLASVTMLDERARLTQAQALILGAVKTLGVEERPGVWNVVLDRVAPYVGITDASVRTHLRNLRSSGIIEYTPPARTKETRIIGELKQEDLDFLDARREAERKKLWQVRDYCDTPDDEKQEYLTRYFSRAW